MQVDLVAVERAVWSGPAQMVVARTVDGDIGVMAGHAPLLAQLKEGFAARIRQADGTILGVAVHGGFLSVTAEGVSILAEDAQLADEIDIRKAWESYERAKAIGTDSAEAEADLRRARAQLLATGQDV
ncbi:MAG TPA: F0F1 ATP synthase subunit epsilon [Nakamurella sp.]|jgi:F-type H+-transporting ATPase subunit epsilon|nr:F0F1 ATP synthase subunit epsilon [Nakamurella sp.]